MPDRDPTTAKGYERVNRNDAVFTCGLIIF
jgi:hypothetical protein